jgi:hypothetical protein
MSSTKARKGHENRAFVLSPDGIRIKVYATAMQALHMPHKTNRTHHPHRTTPLKKRPFPVIN